MKFFVSRALVLVVAVVFLMFARETQAGTPTHDQARVAIPESQQNVQGDDEHFVANHGGDLDQYLFRNQRPDGRLRFNIPITRYYFNPEDTEIEFDSNGFLTQGAVQHAINKGILPETARLTLRAYDVDEDAAGCPEVDYIFVNNLPVPASQGQYKLSGANDTWSTPSFNIPINVLKLPQAKGNDTGPTSINNEISIRIDALNCVGPSGNPAWAVEIDWGVIEILGSVRPIVLVHGWTGDVNSLQQLDTWLAQDGIPSGGRVNLQRGIETIANSAPLLTNAIRHTAQEYGVERVNIFAHSKGGLVGRYALHTSETALMVESLVTLGTPNHGTRMADVPERLLRLQCQSALGTSDPTTLDKCVAAAIEFRISSMKAGFNYANCRIVVGIPLREECEVRYKKASGVDYYSIGSLIDAAIVPGHYTTYPWDADRMPEPWSWNVSKRYNTLSHSGLVNNQDPYHCALRLVGSRVFSCDSRGPVTSQGEQGPTQLITQQTGELNSSGQQDLTVAVDGSNAVIGVYSDESLSVRVTTPSGVVITEDNAATFPNVSYARVSDPIQGVVIQVVDEVPGNWILRLEGGSGTVYAASVSTTASQELVITPESSSVRPNSTVTVETVFISDASALFPDEVEGIVNYPNNMQLVVAFYDDGSHGDHTPNDGIYTTQFDSQNQEGIASIEVVATSEGIKRTTQATIGIIEQTATLERVTSESTTDSDGDGLYDSLDFAVEIDVARQGHFDIYAELVDQQGTSIASGYYSSRSSLGNPLTVGVHEVTLSIAGSDIALSGRDGPYSLTNVKLLDVSSTIQEVDRMDNFYQTRAYSVTQFEQPPLRIVDAEGTPQDTDGDGQYDQVHFSVSLQVLQAGNYNYNGRLVASDGSEVGWYSDTFTSVGSEVVDLELVYDIGESIRDQLTLQDLSVFDNTGGITAVFSEVAMVDLSDPNAVTQAGLLLKERSSPHLLLMLLTALAGVFVVWCVKYRSKS